MRENPYAEMHQKWLQKLLDEGRSRYKCYIVDRRKLEIVHQHVLIGFSGSLAQNMRFDLEDPKTGKAITQISKSDAFPVSGGAEFRLYELIQKKADKLLRKLQDLEKKAERIDFEKILNKKDREHRQRMSEEIARMQNVWLKQSFGVEAILPDVLKEGEDDGSR